MLPARIESKIVRRAEVDGCWEWTGAIEGGGYGTVWVDGRARKAHRVVYELLVGPIPEGHDLDHQCHNRDESCPGGRSCIHRACVNPAHCEPATRSVNVSRGRGVAALNAVKTHCPAGHPYAEHGVYDASVRGRRCTTCRTAQKRAQYLAKRSAR